jgi:hypothetical protein
LKKLKEVIVEAMEVDKDRNTYARGDAMQARGD